MFDKTHLGSDDLLLFEQYRLSTLLSSFDSFKQVRVREPAGQGATTPLVLVDERRDPRRSAALPTLSSLSGQSEEKYPFRVSLPDPYRDLVEGAIDEHERVGWSSASFSFSLSPSARVLFRSRGLSLPNELIVTMIERGAEWKKIFTDQIHFFDEQVRLREGVHLRIDLDIRLILGAQIVDRTSLRFEGLAILRLQSLVDSACLVAG